MNQSDENQDNLHNGLILPNWPAPSQVKACSTTRCIPGVDANTGASANTISPGRNGPVQAQPRTQASQPPYHDFNLGTQVNDNRHRVLQHRHYLQQYLNLPQLDWMKQIHGDRVIVAGERQLEADAMVSTGAACLIQTADCVPVLICNQAGTHVAAVHAGWRGLAKGIIDRTLDALSIDQPSAQWLAWIGPCISAPYYTVDAPVKQALYKYPEALTEVDATHWQADLIHIASQQLQSRSVEVYGGQWCTYRQPELFYSHRRAQTCQQQTGRIAHLIWLTN